MILKNDGSVNFTVFGSARKKDGGEVNEVVATKSPSPSR